LLKNDVSEVKLQHAAERIGELGPDFISEFCEITGCTGEFCNIGHVNFTTDNRLELFLREAPEIFNVKKVLEFGSLECATTIEMFRRTKVQKVVAIEANVNAFDRALEVTSIFPQYAIDLVQGDCVSYLENIVSAGKTTFDTIYLTGILYHLHNPARLFEILREMDIKPNLAIWTHYTNKFSKGTSIYGPNLSRIKSAKHGKYTYSYREFRQDPAMLKIRSYIGGDTGSSRWLTLGSIIKGLEFAGYGSIQVLANMPTDAGPTVQIVATA
jgi:hypothetical protein